MRAAVVQYEQFVGYGVYAETFDLSGTAEIRHLAEQFETPGLGSGGDHPGTFDGVAFFV